MVLFHDKFELKMKSEWNLKQFSGRLYYSKCFRPEFLTLM